MTLGPLQDEDTADPSVPLPPDGDPARYDTSGGPINTVLRELGVVAHRDKDEFDTLGLANYREASTAAEQGYSP